MVTPSGRNNANIVYSKIFGFLCGKEMTPGREHISLESSCLANVCTRIHLPSRYSSIFLKSPINNKISSSFGLHFLHFLLIFFICFFCRGSKEISVVRILRVVRVLRPLRAINRAKGLKVSPSLL